MYVEHNTYTYVYNIYRYHAYIPKAAHQCDVRGNSNISEKEKKRVYSFLKYVLFFTHEEILLFGQIISTRQREILFTFMKSGRPKAVLRS